jgi:exonuclease III
VTPALENALQGAAILGQARGWDKPSDHAPVWIDIEL